MTPNSKSHCEFLRYQARQKFDRVKGTWIEAGKWALPHRTRWLLGQQEGDRLNQHIVDPTHILGLRSFVAGFLEGNTSASRPWYRIAHPDPEKNQFWKNKEWLDIFARRTLYYLSNSNFYTAAGGFYYDFGTFNTGAHYIDELENGQLHFHTLTPGSYYCINNNLGVADIMVREFTLTVHALVKAYGTKKNGNYDWSNFSEYVKKMYEDGNYSEKVQVVQVIKPNDDYDVNKPIVLMNKPWISYTYELGSPGAGKGYAEGQEFSSASVDPKMRDVFLKKTASKRKPFIVGKSDSSDNFEYGEKGPTTDALGLIKSLNKKAIAADMAMEQMLRPAMQGPASLKKSYISSAPNSFVPLDAQSAQAGGIKPLFQVNPAVATVNANIADMRQQVDKLYYADYLLYLSRNPKTRTATETNAVINEQQLIIGPNLQSLNWTYNNPVVEFVMNYVLEEDPHLPPPPEELSGEFLRTEFISVFAQAQKAADLPAIDRYIQMISNVGQLNPAMWDKANLDKLADLYEDRLYLPPGLNNPQSKVDAMREKAQAQAQRQAKIEQLQGVAGAMKDMGAQIPPRPEGQTA